MARRAWVAMALGTVALVALVLAASAGHVSLWSVTTQPTEVGPSETLPPLAEPTSVSVPPVTNSNDDVFVQVVVVLSILIGVVALVWLLRVLWHRPTWRGRRRAWPTATGFDVLDVVPEPPLEVDAVAARAALAEGDPRNAIVACWMQLEHDAARAGLPRDPAETSAEYVARVIGASSVDPGPIGELAALFREARFSAHPLDDVHRARAVSALDRVLAALGTATLDIGVGAAT